MSKDSSVNWVDDPKVEDVLKKLGLKFKVKVIKLDDVDWKKSAINSGRVGKPINEDTVDDYALSQKAGDRFPRPLAIEEKGVAPYYIAGVHRSKAAIKNGVKEIPSYVVQIRLPHEARLIAVMTNRKEGVRLNKEEALANALYLVQNYEITYQDAAKLLGIGLSSISNRIQTDRLKKQAFESGFMGTLPVAHWDRLSKLKSNSKVLVAAAEFLEKHKIPQAEIPRFTDNILERKTEAQQLSFIEKQNGTYSVSAEVAKANPVFLPVRTKFIRALHSLSTIAGGKTCTQLQIEQGTPEFKALKEEWVDLRKRLDKVFR